MKCIFLAGIWAALVAFTGCGTSYKIGKSILLSDIYSVHIGGSDGMTYSSQWSYYAHRSSDKESAYIEYTHWDKAKNEIVKDRYKISDGEYMQIIKVAEGCLYVKNPKPKKHVLDAPGFCGVSIGCKNNISGSYHMQSPDGSLKINGQVIQAIRSAAGIK
ncbi:MAG: hypothetical protein IKQ13_00345 [Treponema sp.]|nr:hypothetical protein [Treponema sp.]